MKNTPIPLYHAREIHIYDITRSYYNRIFRDTQSADAVTEAVLDLISGSDPEHAINVLLRRGFSPKQGYLAYCINGKGEQEGSKFENTVRLELKVHFPGSHMCHFREDILALLPCTDKAELTPSGAGASAELKNAVRDLAGRISRSFPRWDIRSGLGSISELKEFPRSFWQARSARVSSFSRTTGIIEIFRELLGYWSAMGRARERDRLEVIAHLIEDAWAGPSKGNLVAAVRNAVRRLEGSWALAVVCADAPGEIVCARNGSPLVVASTDGVPTPPPT